jgi:hypothetical protein
MLNRCFALLLLVEILICIGYSGTNNHDGIFPFFEIELKTLTVPTVVSAPFVYRDEELASLFQGSL